MGQGWNRLKLRNRGSGHGMSWRYQGLFVTKGFGGLEGSWEGTPGQKLKNLLKLSCVVQRRCEQGLNRGGTGESKREREEKKRKEKHLLKVGKRISTYFRALYTIPRGPHTGDYAITMGFHIKRGQCEWQVIPDDYPFLLLLGQRTHHMQVSRRGNQGRSPICPRSAWSP